MIHLKAHGMEIYRLRPGRQPEPILLWRQRGSRDVLFLGPQVPATIKIPGLRRRRPRALRDYDEYDGYDYWYEPLTPVETCCYGRRCSDGVYVSRYDRDDHRGFGGTRVVVNNHFIPR